MSTDDGDALTEPFAHELAASLRAGEVSSREVTAAHLARAHRTDAGLHAWLTLDDERALAEADAADARLAAARARGSGRARGAPPAARRADRAQGPRLAPRRPVHRGLEDPRRLSLAVRRAHHRAAARRGRGDPGQDEHGRVRDGLVDRAQRVRADGQPVGPRACARRLVGRLGGGRRRAPRPALDRHRHRRLDPPAGRPVRDRRDEADLRPRVALRDRRVRQQPRPDRPVRP